LSFKTAGSADKADVSKDSGRTLGSGIIVKPNIHAPTYSLTHAITATASAMAKNSLSTLSLLRHRLWAL
jgi:hypothetical protein